MKFTKQDLIDLKHSQILTQNSKMRKTSKENNIRLYNFGITAYKSHSTGKITCPFADSCISLCYANKGSYIWTNTKKAYEKRYLLSKDPELFKSKLIDAITRRKATHIRIHDSGDFYNFNYIRSWFSVMYKFPKVKFYAYTKSKKLFDHLSTKPTNFVLIYSLGSKFDNLVDLEKDRHSKIFYSIDQMHKENYIDASSDDLLAINTSNNKIGLLIH